MKATSFRFGISPNSAWVFVFVPAFVYYLRTRLVTLGLFRSSTVGKALPYFVPQGGCSYLSKHVLPHLMNCHPHTQQPEGLYYQILNEPNMVNTAWKHDEELGRGYLLISTSLGKGKIWQWETGGGPIPIGKTLHLQDSGCRAKDCSQSFSGSGGIAVDAWHKPPRLIISEWGENRIIRLEPESGARTPIVIQHYQKGYPMNRPRQLLLMAFGDLIILDHHNGGEEEDSGDVLWQLSQVSKVPPLSSLAESRRAHSWTAVNTTSVPQLLLQQPQIGGVTLVPKEWLSLYVTMEVNEKVALASLSLGDEETPQQSKLLMDFSEYASRPGPLLVDEKGHLYLAVDQGVLIVEPPNRVRGFLSLPNVTEPIISMTLGEDRFLYVATRDTLYRVKTRNKAMEVPSNLVIQ